MTIQDLQAMYATLPQVGALAKILEDSSVKTVFLDGLLASSAPMVFGSLDVKSNNTVLFILQDADEAGYFYHDLTQVMGQESVLFFPSSYRRAVKYGQRDPASEILRTEVLAALNSVQSSECGVQRYDYSQDVASVVPDGNHTSSLITNRSSLYIVSFPEAVAELVVSRKRLDSRTLSLAKDTTVDVMEVMRTLREFGFHEVEYVYEPGQFALRGSILDVYSYSCEYPYRVDFFGDDIDSIRTFEVETQLSRDRRDEVRIVPELAGITEDRIPLLSFLPEGTLIVMKDSTYVRDAVERTYQEGFSQQAIVERTEGATEMEQRAIIQQMRKEVQLVSGARFADDVAAFRIIEIGHRPLRQPDATIRFNITAQPLSHKNFDLLTSTFEDYLLRGYRLYILADSKKQNERLKEILSSEVQSSECGVKRYDNSVQSSECGVKRYDNSVQSAECRVQRYDNSQDLNIVDKSGSVTNGGHDDAQCPNPESNHTSSLYTLHSELKKPVGLFKEYYRDEEQTRRVWHDGMYHTGDVAWRDEDGYYWFVGRIDDVIKSSGYRIGPFEVESALMTHPAVVECAITGVPDDIRGMVVKATVVLHAEWKHQAGDELVKELQAHVKRETAPYKYPRIIEFVDELPKTISGKIRRVEIREKDKNKE